MASTFELASTIQAASINRNPDPHIDINPSTAASQKVPVTISDSGDISDVEDDEIPTSVLRPVARKQTLPPLPDLRFEQSYLRSIEKAESWGAIAWITLKDQVFFPLFQGTLWELTLTGWRFWTKASSGSGATYGSKIRSWLVTNGYLRR
ncbi:DUF1770-domain-containing protein [Microthyrium microscopicum]|uniref:DUF1770-domain-containing protein n=1 Tax=Microthyrium microscopicum TaxID=703497 RepID=A0A6A6UK34_9PEZI|nr:DUF1770-domain-containing protein [Microthyrium microscopicum]